MSREKLQAKIADAIKDNFNKLASIQFILPQINELIDFLELSDKFSKLETRKARIEWILSKESAFFPSKMLINRMLVNVEHAERLREVIQKAIERGFVPGVRTCFQGQINKSPWIMGLGLDNLDEFMDIIYPDWASMNGIRELIVMENPSELGELERVQEHMVCRTEFFPQQHRLYFEMMLETDQFRDLDKVTAGRRINGNIHFGNSGSIASIDVDFGMNHTDSGSSESLCLWGNEENLDLNSGELIKPKSLKVTIEFLCKILSWWYDSEVILARKFETLDELGLSMLEFQGRVDNHGGLEWLKIYGVRGAGDERGNWANVSKMVSIREIA